MNSIVNISPLPAPAHSPAHASVTKNTLKKTNTLTKRTTQNNNNNNNNNKKSKKLKSNFTKSILSLLCNDSSICINFGVLTINLNEMIKNYFDNFDFKYISEKNPNSVVAIGAPSGNGFVKLLTYENDGHKAHAILKSTLRENEDNLMYEYEVGQFINKQNKIFSCFIETYGLFKYKDNKDIKKDESHRIMSEHKTGYKDLNTMLEKITEIDYKVGCEEEKYLAILIQYIPGAITLYDFIMRLTKDHDLHFLYELLCILYQIYFPLSVLKDEFTHYDLHDKNVLLYKPKDNSYITYNYTLLNGTIFTFKSFYIVKIIDYGRSYYKDRDVFIPSSNIKNNKKIEKSSLNTYNTKIYTATTCEQLNNPVMKFRCFGHRDGFPYLDSRVKNNSCDLYLLTIIEYYLSKFRQDLYETLATHENVKILEKKTKDLKIIKDLLLFKKLLSVTETCISEGKDDYPQSIQTINDVIQSITEYIKQYKAQFEYNIFNNATEFAVCNMYENRNPMIFTHLQHNQSQNFNNNASVAVERKALNNRRKFKEAQNLAKVRHKAENEKKIRDDEARNEAIKLAYQKLRAEYNNKVSKGVNVNDKKYNDIRDRQDKETYSKYLTEKKNNPGLNISTLTNNNPILPRIKSILELKAQQERTLKEYQEAQNGY